MNQFIIITQARMTSTRLPGKVMKTFSDGKSLLQLQIERLKMCKLVDDVIVATTTNWQDDEIEILCRKMDVLYFRGSEDNVLERYYLASKISPSRNIIRVTSDCPFLDPSIVDETITQFIENQADYASSSESYPNGMNVEVFKNEILEEAFYKNEKAYEREHVTPYIYTHPEKFNIYLTKSLIKYPKYRLTVDTPEDFKLLNEIYDRLPNKDTFTLTDICNILENEPGLIEINDKVVQKKYNE